mmetsp:Transcript_46371/g.91479  ORF Transcript_46371/g.91479 Transcript_46371/m.91479 type:complete len:468 (-) Transcript_46371:756-2159(-)
MKQASQVKSHTTPPDKQYTNKHVTARQANLARSLPPPLTPTPSVTTSRKERRKRTERGTQDGFRSEVGHPALCIMPPPPRFSPPIHLQEFRDVHRHLLDLSLVVLLNVLHQLLVVCCDEVDGDSLTTETSATADSMQVVLDRRRQVVVDDQGNLLDIDSSGKQIRCDQHTGGPGPELPHDQLALLLRELGVHGGDSKILLVHVLGQVVDLLSGVAINDGLCDCDSLVKVAQSFKLPLLLLHSHVELTDTLKGQFVPLDENSDRVPHEFRRQLEDIVGHGSTEQGDLHRLGKSPEDVVDLVLEPSGEHFVRLVQNEELDVVEDQILSLDHVKNTTGGSDNEMDAGSQLGNVVTDLSSSHAGVALDLEVVSKRDDDFLDLKRQLARGSEDQGLASHNLIVNALENRDGERGRLSGSRLSLTDGVPFVEDRLDASLLNGRGLLKTVRVDSSQKFLAEVQSVEGLSHLVIV